MRKSVKYTDVWLWLTFVHKKNRKDNAMKKTSDRISYQEGFLETDGPILGLIVGQNRIVKENTKHIHKRLNGFDGS